MIIHQRTHHMVLFYGVKLIADIAKLSLNLGHGWLIMSHSVMWPLEYVVMILDV